MSPPNPVRSSGQYDRLTNLCSPGWRMQRHAVGCNMACCCQTTTSHRVAQRQSTPKPCYQGYSPPTRESNAQPVLFSSSTHWQHHPNTHNYTEQASTPATPTGRLNRAAHGVRSTSPKPTFRFNEVSHVLAGCTASGKVNSLRAHRVGRKKCALDVVRTCLPNGVQAPRCNSHTHKRASPNG